ncbi:MalY/PatB family protein [Fusibacter ferrireducens]|uniref:cysteine-S-conjugate beta-lyase n=1 Tax=Fusibacter ferrireducens TaxID=2785058 RepID=A0ABR9ZSD6_9FIRM|nr:MalY/PatB family protein [Fusibacter ferrireducens]MBF4693372.1 pyridoxal phosphate-dependent aminotransferase [Fusibacter ferrireducens]
MKHNFDEVIDRKNTNAMKYEPSVLKEMFKSEDVLPMWVADMDFRCPEVVVDAISERAKHGIFGYSGVDDAYYDVFIDWNKRRNQWHIHRDWICYTPGIVPAVHYIIRAFCHTGDKVIIQNPVYYPFAQAIVNNGAQVVTNPLKREGGQYIMDYEDFEAKAKDPRVKLFILCSPHNPIGRVWRKDELEKIGEICLANNVLVVSDEIHSDLIMSGHKHIPFASLSEAFSEHSITCMAPSKTFNIAGLQVSNIIIPNAELRMAYQTILENNAIRHANTFGIVAQKAAYGMGEPWLNEALEYIEANMDYIADFVKARLPEITFVKPEATYLAWLDFNQLGMSPSELETWMQTEVKLALDEGYIFGAGGEGYERINVACPRSILKEALERIEKAVIKRRA